MVGTSPSSAEGEDLIPGQGARGLPCYLSCNAGEPCSIPGSGRSPGEGIGSPLQYSWASLVTQLVNNLPAVHETLVPSLGCEDSLEEGIATHSSIVA